MRFIRGVVIASWKLYPIPRAVSLKNGRLRNFCSPLRGHYFLKTKLTFNKYLLYGSKRLFNADKRQPIPLEWSMKNKRTEINGESTSMVRPTLGSTTAKELNITRWIGHWCFRSDATSTQSIDISCPRSGPQTCSSEFAAARQTEERT